MNGAVVGKRVSLRAIREEDLASIEAWYEEVARWAFEDRSLEESRFQASAGRAGLLAIEQFDSREPIGFVEYEGRDGWLLVPFIALAYPHRGWGYGSEAVRLLEEWAVHEGLARRFRADVPVRNGLGLYFWLRLGYRPAGTGEFDWHAEGEADRMAMVRVAAQKGEPAQER